jgi:CBS domain-containing protein
VETAAISYRVADFLKQYPPFHAMEEGDLLKLAQQGRVKFFEPNEYILWQGASRFQVFVIQQGTVSLWDEESSEAQLRDMRGPGDLLGIDQFDEARTYPHSARSSSDVLIYAFPADEFGELVQKYPYAKQYVSAYGSVTAEYRSPEERRDPRNTFLHDLVSLKALPVLDGRMNIQEAARHMLTTGTDAFAVLDPDQRVRAVITAKSFLKWIEAGGGDAREPVAKLFDAAPPAIIPAAHVSDGVLAMGEAGVDSLILTSDGSPTGRAHAIVTARDFSQVFGDEPVDILRQIERAPNAETLGDLNQRARALVLRYLSSAASFDWLAGFTSLVDSKIVSRVIAMTVPDELGACWCFCGSSGRGESLTRLAPELVMIADDHESSRSADAHHQVTELLEKCGYLPNTGTPFESSFFAASLSKWRQRYLDWIDDPILKQIYLAHPLFDLRYVLGRKSFYQELERSVDGALNRDFLQILANDCLASLPPLTFFRDTVLDETGAETAVFRLEHSALRPLVDVGRVFGMATKRVFGSSTLDRFAMARRLLPDQASIFREASETLRIVLWQQGRVGITQGTGGTELPPSLLSRYDRQILRSGFRSILRLLEFTADPSWLQSCD